MRVRGLPPPAEDIVQLCQFRAGEPVEGGDGSRAPVVRPRCRRTQVHAVGLPAVGGDERADCPTVQVTETRTQGGRPCWGDTQNQGAGDYQQRQQDRDEPPERPTGRPIPWGGMRMGADRHRHWGVPS